MASTDYANRLREYRKLLRLCESSTAVGSKRTPVLVRHPAGRGWYPTLLLSRTVGWGGKVNVLAFNIPAVTIAKGFVGEPAEPGYPEVWVNQVEQCNVRVLPRRLPELERLLAAVDAYCPQRYPSSSQATEMHSALGGWRKSMWDLSGIVQGEAPCAYLALARRLPVLNLPGRGLFFGRHAAMELE